MPTPLSPRPPALLVALLSTAALLAAACSGDRGASHLARGNVLVNNGKREEALAEYREAARLSPKSTVARERLADTLYDLGKKDEALAEYRAVAAQEPGQVTAHIGAARVLADAGDLSQARAELTAALQAAPTNLFALLSRANLAARAGDRKAALADAAQAVHFKSDNVPALSAYGLLLLDDGQQAEAEATFDRLVQRAPDSPAGWYGKARAAAHRGDAAAAGQALREAAARALPDARHALLEQGVPPEKAEAAAGEQAGRALAALKADPAFASLSQDPSFRSAAGW
jgi:tetratricopeptide (TPR) repeat protein